MSDNADQVQETIIGNLEAALRDWYDGNPYSYSELFADRFTYFDPLMNERLETREQLREHYSKLAGQVNLPRHEIIEPDFSFEGEVVVLTYFLKQFSDDGPVGPTWKTTEIYRDIQGAWRAVHAHWSAIPE